MCKKPFTNCIAHTSSIVLAVAVPLLIPTGLALRGGTKGQFPHFSEYALSPLRGCTDHRLKQDFMLSAPRNDLVRKNEALQVKQAKRHEKSETVTPQKL